MLKTKGTSTFILLKNKSNLLKFSSGWMGIGRKISQTKGRIDSF